MFSIFIIPSYSIVVGDKLFIFRVYLNRLRRTIQSS
jgi:hypothetical protein